MPVYNVALAAGLLVYRTIANEYIPMGQHQSKIGVEQSSVDAIINWIHHYCIRICFNEFLKTTYHVTSDIKC